jgi:hypothetical protein
MKVRKYEETEDPEPGSRNLLAIRTVVAREHAQEDIVIASSLRQALCLRLASAHERSEDVPLKHRLTRNRVRPGNVTQQVMTTTSVARGIVNSVCISGARRVRIANVGNYQSLEMGMSCPSLEGVERDALHSIKKLEDEYCSDDTATQGQAICKGCGCLHLP